MKKILSLGLAVTMAMAALPTAFAAETQDYTLGSQVSVIGNAASEYEIKVPARLEAGGAAGNVVATGTWRSSETLIVTAADEVEVTEEATGAKTMVPVVFDGINAKGNDLAAMSISKAVSVEKGDILFGTWTGVIEYNVELDDGIERIDFSVGGITYKAEVGMTWEAWVESSYNTDGFQIANVKTNTGYEMTAIVNADKENFIRKGGMLQTPEDVIVVADYALPELGDDTYTLI